jgi:hypothetical protein
MSLADALAIAGLILTIIFGLPVIPLFAKGNAFLAAVAAILALISLSLTAIIYRLLSLPPWSIVVNHTRLEVLDHDGHTARVRKTMTIRANEGGLEHYTYRNISCDGAITEVRVDPNVRMERHERTAGDHFVTVRFPHQVGKYKTVTTWLEFDLTDAFTSERESFVLQVDQRTHNAEVEIVLPATRPPRAGSLVAAYRYSGREEELEPPEVVGAQIKWSRKPMRMRRLALGEYAISWSW